MVAHVAINYFQTGKLNRGFDIEGAIDRAIRGAVLERVQCSVC